MEAGIVALLLTISHLALATASASHALIYKRDPRAAIAWMVVSVTVPFIGPVIYYMFGINRVRTAAIGYRNDRLVSYERPERYSEYLGCASPVDALSMVGATVSGNRMLCANSVEPLINGEATYAAMLEAINEASDFVHLTTYILESGDVGKTFIDALAQAVERGVDVRVLIDGFGQYYAIPTATRLLRKAGVPVQCYLPPRLFPPSLHVNLRNHRKVLVVDGVVAFTGGANIGRRHIADEHGVRQVTDIHFRLQGPVVSELDEVFCHDWCFVTGAALPPAPVDTRCYEEAVCRVIMDGPDEHMDKLSMVIQGVISAARRRITIMTPYFLPSRELVAALQAAACRGVKIRVILPAENNLPFVHWATRNMLWELLMWDIEVQYQSPPFCHSKLLLIDDDYALIGSANLDPRSLRLNFELGVEVFDRKLVAQLDQHIEETCCDAHNVTLEEVDGRPLHLRMWDSAFWLMSPYL
ncbi:MAG: cardiolipin synthase [Gammaproteobacteria bacterium]|nr:cardiolipin synthase [Gammaproteobacteria bacterium]